jgi:hypothetical protein
MIYTGKLQSAANKLQSNDDIIDCISNAIEQTLGNEASELFFKTLNIVYHLDTESIPMEIDRFEETTRRMMSDVIADVILATALEEIDKKQKIVKTT